MSAEAGSGGRGVNNFYGDGGAGGSDNTVAAFDDRLTAGDDDDTIVGDVRHAGSGSVSLSAKAGSGGDGTIYSYTEGGGDGGVDNTVAAFNDRLTAGGGDDTIVGDVTHSGAGDIDLNAECRSWRPQRWRKRR